ncbi:MAG: DUF1049 domain-containing protein [Actinobacteria bacterium]|nr:DUF1049 domain-containing protein [Actinomycetota bacterium]MBU1493572.1 DUF1049 domain-containing protein [Actinomycetota bacterium]
MSADERNDLPPLAAGASGGGHHPYRDAFGEAVPAEPSEPVEEIPAATEKATEAGGKPESHPQFVGTGVFWGLVIGIVLAVVVIVFAAQNTAAVGIKVLAWHWLPPLFVVVLVSLIIGIVLDEIVGLLFRSRRRRRLAERAELHRLRGKR